MKQRIFNTFIRKIKIKSISNILTATVYFILMVGYCILSCFKKVKRNNIEIENEIDNARDSVTKIYPKPHMDAECSNNEIDGKIDLSIVVPAYNVEKFIAKCIDSILSQKTKYKYELIIVNDGSIDSTKRIIEDYSDERIRLINQGNQGLSGARNTGINASRGKYITFVDSDDYLLDGSIEEMVSQAISNNADVVVGSHYMFVDGADNKEECIQKKEVIENNSEKAIDNPGYAWGKVFKRDLFNKIRFPMGAWFEDALICSIIYRMSKKMVVLDQMVYAYRINPMGISQTARKSPKCIDHYWVMEDVLRQADGIGLSHDETFYKIMIGQMSTFLYRRISLLPEETKKNVFIMACDYLKKIKPKGHIVKGNKIEKDLENAFETGNYKLWKLASFVV